MSTKSDVIHMLSTCDGAVVSGQEIADTIGVSRNAVWKAIKSLQAQGVPIKSVGNSGYSLNEYVDVLSRSDILSLLDTPFDVHVFDTIDSTNSFAKSLPVSDVPQLIVADAQTSGRGRSGRNFISPAGKGLYLSIAFAPEFNLDRASLITAISALAATRAIEKVTGIRCGIKWVNDIYLNDKKICGILTEAEINLEAGEFERIVVGFGVNCFKSDFPDEIKDIAGYIENPTRSFTRSQLAAEIANELCFLISDISNPDILRSYRSRSVIIGQQIMVYNQAIAASTGRPESRLNEGVRAKALDIDENGGLIIEILEGRRSKELCTLSTGEVSIRKI